LFDPRAGQFTDAGFLQTNAIGVLSVPAFPTDNDWGLRLRYAGKQ